MKIIVTGGAGFIGSHITDAYIKSGHNVVVIDNLKTGSSSKKNLNPKAKFYLTDIKNQKNILKIFKQERPEVVNHHAAIAEVVKSLKDPIPTFEVNVLGTANILIASGQNNIKKFIFSSTGGAIYGEPKKIPADEKTEVTPLSAYGTSKFLGEELIKFYSRIYKFNYSIFRYPNVYGPRQNPKGEAGVVAIFHELMKNQKQPTIFGDGTKTRDYVYIKDIVRANLKALATNKNILVNLGSTKETSDQEIFDILIKLLDFKKKPIYAPFRSGEVYRIALTNNLAKKLLNWEPSYNIKKGIKEYHRIQNLNSSK